MPKYHKKTNETTEKKSVGYLGGTAQVIVINLFNSLEVNEPFQLGLMLV